MLGSDCLIQCGRAGGHYEKEWRCYLIFLKNKGHKNATLAQVARKLVMELEPKITEVELIRDCEKNPLHP